MDQRVSYGFVPVKAEYSLSTSLCISLGPLETDWDLPDRGLFDCRFMIPTIG